MKKASFLGIGQTNNGIFDCSPQKNLDNWYYPYGLLRKVFEENGVELNTADINGSFDVAFELHIDVQKQINRNIPCYVMLYETPEINPNNHSKSALEKYRLIFTWRKDLVDGRRYIKFYWPQTIVVNDSRGWQGRDKLCCMISSNRTGAYASPLLLYSERVRTIRWFEQYAPRHFDLFGLGWDAPAAKHGFVGRVISKLRRHTSPKSGKVYFPSYRGKVASKLETMQKYRFSICYENVRDVPDYMTEKIFDSFFSGCVPVYWGPPNIATYVPEDCFIDRVKFTSHEELYKFMISMTESEYVAYQERIAAYLASDQARRFGAEAFAETIVTTIMSDLGHTP